MEWSMPFTSPGVFEDAILAKGAPDLKLLAPVGVTLTGEGITALGKEPTTGATIYNVPGAKFSLIAWKVRAYSENRRCGRWR